MYIVYITAGGHGNLTSADHTQDRGGEMGPQRMMSVVYTIGLGLLGFNASATARVI